MVLTADVSSAAAVWAGGRFHHLINDFEMKPFFFDQKQHDFIFYVLKVTRAGTRHHAASSSRRTIARERNPTNDFNEYMQT